MAKTPKKDSINTIFSPDFVDLTLRLSKEPLYTQVKKFQTHLGASSEQEAIRIALTRFFADKGFN